MARSKSDVDKKDEAKQSGAESGQQDEAKQSGAESGQADAEARDQWQAIVDGTHFDPHRVLGVHVDGDAAWVRAFRPDASAVSILLPTGASLPMSKVHDGGGWESARDRVSAW